MATVAFDEFTRAFLEAALFSSTDEADETGGQPLDENYSIEDFDHGSLMRLMEDCAKFQASPEWQAALEANACVSGAWRDGYSQEAMGGHDFWLTRCGHGAGFWDGDWTEPHATALDTLSQRFGGVDLTVGDDHKIYAMI